MKNMMNRALILATVAIMLFALASCGGGNADKSGAIKAAFEKEGYTVTSTKYADMDEDAKEMLEMALSDDMVDKMANYEIILLSKKVAGFDVPTAFVVKCDSATAVKDFLTVTDEEGAKDTTLYDEAVDEGIINGNCFIITIDPDCIDLFKNA